MDLSDFLAVRSGVSIVELLRKLSEGRKKKLDEDDLREISQLAIFNFLTNLTTILYLMSQERTNSGRKSVLDAFENLHISTAPVILEDPELQEIFSSTKEIEEFKNALPDIFAEWKRDLGLESD